MDNVRVLVVAGTRPEFIKLAPVVWRLRERIGDRLLYLFTGQHYDQNMAGDSIWNAGQKWLPPDRVLAWKRNGSHSALYSAAEVCELLRDALKNETRKGTRFVVVVQGDTASGYGGALYANEEELPLVHIEAGLRCFDSETPEEEARVYIDQQADVLLCPSTLSAAFAQRDAKPNARIVITGQTGRDAFREATLFASKELVIEKMPERWALCTFHRHHWSQQPLLNHVEVVSKTLRENGIEPVLIRHPRWPVDWVRSEFRKHCTVIDPIPYGLMANYLRHQGMNLIVTDSGGLVEEAYECGIPCVITRPNTERWECLQSGRAILAPTIDHIAPAINAAFGIGRQDPMCERSAYAGPGYRVLHHPFVCPSEVVCSTIGDFVTELEAR